MPVKVDPLIIEELAAMDLTLWEAKHPRQAFVNKAGKMSSREDKSWVIVSLAGPGVTEDARAGAATLRQAVDTALQFYFSDRVPGIKGAILRLNKAVWDLSRRLVEDRYTHEYGYDEDGDCIPF